MHGDTFRSRLLTLLQRSRQAHRLYSSMERLQRGEAAEFTEMQATEWRSVNAELIRQLTALLDAPHTRQLSSQIFLLRDRFLNDFRVAEAELAQRQRELLSASEKGDFIKAAVVSRSLVSLKARTQASQAAFGELDELLNQTRTSTPAEECVGMDRPGASSTDTPRDGSATKSSEAGVAPFGAGIPDERRVVTGEAQAARALLTAGASGGGLRGAAFSSALVGESPRAKIIPLRKR